MFAPKPPQPVGRRRAVAAMIVAHEQAATIAPGHLIEIPAPVPAKPLPTIPAAPPGVSRIDDDTPI